MSSSPEMMCSASDPEVFDLHPGEADGFQNGEIHRKQFGG